MQTEQPAPPNEAPSESKWVPRLIPPFGQVDDFWKHYDTLADKKDKEMLASLNSNLDVLLIFAGLFSAINTAFISFTMPGLSPDATSETNTLLRLLVMRADNNTLTAADLSPPFSPDSRSVAANCLLYASLCCSLLAAMGAMLGKEWLQSYGRSGQAGPVEEQARFRQKKFTGAQEWHLESIIGFLPNLLLVSVLLFFIGLIIFLMPVDAAVAGVVIALVGSGVALGCATIAAGASYLTCPYQTALSRGLRRVAELVLRATRVNKDNSGNANEQSRDQKQDDILNGQAASWLLEATSDPIDQLAIARNIYGLGAHGITAILNSTNLDRLVSLARDALQRHLNFSDETTANISHDFGVALAYVLRHEPDEERSSKVRGTILSSLGENPPQDMDRLRSIIEDEYTEPKKNMHHPTKLLVLHEEIIRNNFLYWDDFEVFLSEQYDDTMLGMLAYSICRRLPEASIRDVQGFTKTAEPSLEWNDYSGAMLLPLLVTACSAGPEVWANSGFRALPERVLKVYGTFLRRIQLAVRSERDLAGFSAKFGAAIEAGFYEILRTSKFALAKDPIDLIPVALKAFRIVARLSNYELPPGWDRAYLTTLWSAVGAVIQDPRLPTDPNFRENAEKLSLAVFRWTVSTRQFDDSAVILNGRPEVLEYLSSCLQRKLDSPDPDSDFSWRAFIIQNNDTLFSDETLALQSLWLDCGLSSVVTSLFRASWTLVSICYADNVLKKLCELSTLHSHKLARDGIVGTLLELMQRADEKGESFDEEWEVAKNILLRRILLIWIEVSDVIKWTPGGWLPAINNTLITWLKYATDSHLDRRGHFHLQAPWSWLLEVTIPCVSLMAFLYDIRAQLPTSDLEACDFNSTVERFDSLFQKLLGRGPVFYGNSELPPQCSRFHFVDDQLL